MKKFEDVLIIGFALFSIFFGAGNLIFPPYLGVTSGHHWLIAFLGFILFDVGIILISILAIAKKGSLQGVIGRAGNKFGLTLEVITMLCLGPILVVPRTAATTYEMGISPIFGNINSLVFSIVFFTIVYILTIRPSKVTDIIGKFLTPLLLGALAILIVKGIVTPISDINTQVSSDGVFSNGIYQGFQTMGALGLGGVTAFIMSSFKDKGYNNKNDLIKLTLQASLVAGLGLVIVYAGLAYLGSTTSTIYNSNVSQTTLLIDITYTLLGPIGKIVLGVIASFACLTTAMGLTSITGKYFEGITNNKIKYEAIVLIICVFSTFSSNLGVDKIIQIAGPILSILYPVLIVLTIMSLLDKYIVSNASYILTAYTTLFISLVGVLNGFGLNLTFVNNLPLANLGLNWVMPALISCIIPNILFIMSRNKINA